MRPQLGKQKIFDAALKLFASQGFFGTTVEQITAEAGVSKGLVYNYFNSKEELLSGLIQNATSEMASVANNLLVVGTVEESLSDFLDSYFAYLKAERKFLSLQLSWMLMPELQSIVAIPREERAQLLLATVTRWFKRSNVAQSKSRARLFVAMLDGIALHYLCVYESYPLASMKPLLVQTTQDMCSSSKKKD